MLDGCGALLWLALLTVGVVVALRSFRVQMREEIGKLRQRVVTLEMQIAGQDARPTGTEQVDHAEDVRDPPPEPPETPPAAKVEPSPEPVSEPEAVEPREIAPSPMEDVEAPAPAVETRPPRAAAEPSASPSFSLSDLEERLGARLPVWIGAAALALAGAFLVKYSLDQGWLGPPVRVGLAVALGLALLGAGEWMSRFPGTVAQGLSAAGVAVLFSSWLAAVQLYELLSPAAGFGLMAATAALAVGLSLRRGPMVALIGLLGGLLTPYLIRLEEPRAWTLFGYLLLVEGGVLAVSRRRGWTAVAVVSLGGGFLWTLLWMAGFGVGEPVWPATFLLATAVAGVLATGAGGLQWGSGSWPNPQATLVARLAVAGSLVLLAVLTGVEGYSTTEWAFLGILAAGILVLGRLDSRFEFLPPVAAGAVAVLLASWIPDLTHAAFPRFVGALAALTILFGGGGFVALWGARSPTTWGSLSAAAGIAGPPLAWAGARTVGVELSWGLLFLTVAAVYCAGAGLLLARRTSERQGALEAIALAAAVPALLAAILELDGRPLTLVLVAAVPVLAALSEQWKISTLRGLTWLLVVGVFARRFLTEPILAGEVSAAWLWVDFGVPVAAFAAAARLLRREPDARDPRPLARTLEGLALVFVLAFVGFLLHRVYLPETWISAPRELDHWGALINAWLLVALALGGLVDRLSRPASLGGGAFAGASLAALAVVLGPVLAANPAWTSLGVGTWPVVNVLLWVYGLPALLFAVLARGFRRRGMARVVYASFYALALFLLFVLVTLEVRQAFRGEFLTGGPASHAEQYAYSAAWIVLSTLLLVAGIARQVSALRWAALAVMTVTVGKVFLYDTAHLSDLYRVVSYLGLGLSLMLLAWLYQRFVFRGDEDEEESETTR